MLFRPGIPGTHVAITTKADLEARIQELETQLAASTSDPKEAGMVRLVGMLRGVKDITRPDGPIAACAILSNQTSVRRADGSEVRVDLPIDSLICRDNGKPLASEMLAIARSTEWARVAVYGYWATFGEVTRNERGYAMCQRRQLRVMRIDVLNSKPLEQQEDLSMPEYDPTSQEQFAPF